MHTFEPSASFLLPDGASSELKPGFTKIVIHFISARHPDHHWSSISDVPKPRITVSQCQRQPGTLNHESSDHYNLNRAYYECGNEVRLLQRPKGEHYESASQHRGGTQPCAPPLEESRDQTPGICVQTPRCEERNSRRRWYPSSLAGVAHNIALSGDRVRTLNPPCWDTRPDPSQTSDPCRSGRVSRSLNVKCLLTLLHRVAKIPLKCSPGTVNSDSY